MGQTSILTKTQRQFLELVLKEPYLLKRFYWTGGTVLAEFYLKHRESEDIDLFSESQEIHQPSIDKFVGLAGGSLGAKNITHRRFLGLHSYIFVFPKSQLKIDFNFYPFTRIERGRKWRSLAIDSLKDIAVNKLHTISTRARDRDFVDLYFILKKEKWVLKELIVMAKTKLDWHIDPIQLGQNFTQVTALKDVPRMLIPFNRQKMEKFFLDLALSLKSDIFKA